MSVSNIKREHWYFSDFLDKELQALGLTHRYENNGGHNDHSIYKVVGGGIWSLAFTDQWSYKNRVARILNEPETRICLRRQDILRIQVFDLGYWSDLKELAEKFKIQDFGVKAEIFC